METIQNFDVAVFRFINNLAGSLSWLNFGAIFFAEYAIFILALFMFVLWIMKHKMRRTLIAAFIAFIIAALVAKVAGHFFYHMQPFAELNDVFQLIPKKVGNAFPSDHTAAAFAVCVTLFLGHETKWRGLYIILAILVGFSRIWVGVHYPIDVLLGAIIGTVVACTVSPFVMHAKITTAFLNFYQNIERKLFGAPGRHRHK